MVFREPILSETPPGTIRIGTKGGGPEQTIAGVLYSGGGEVMYQMEAGTARTQMQFLAGIAHSSGWHLDGFQCKPRNTSFANTSDQFSFRGWKSFGSWWAELTVFSGGPVVGLPSPSATRAVPEAGVQAISVNIYIPSVVDSVGATPSARYSAPSSGCLYDSA